MTARDVRRHGLRERNTPTTCETCGDAGWFTADPSDPEFCECAAGKRLMAANNADPDTPTADDWDETARHYEDDPSLLVGLAAPMADAPADTDLRDEIMRVLLPLQNEAGQVGSRILADALLPLVRAQVEAARRDALDEAADDLFRGKGPASASGEVGRWLRDRAATR